ncbi:OmpA family protein [Granulicella sp. 5B5]|uniref:OmpA family protein n=1 Tax=Granulicella sp. 5B5 TaxID=1617967 RepID=UPI0015F4C7C3|nr:OmpA family protein [Granulicella sp. 5B5]
MSFAMLTFSGVTVQAQSNAELQGMIVGRDGPTMYVKTGDTRQIVTLQDNTQATEKGGFLGWSHKDLGIAALVPGLEVKVDGTYDQDHKLIARKVEFTRGSMRTANQIDAGLTPTNAKVAAQQDALMSARRDIESTQADIAASKQQIAANQQQEQQDAQQAQTGIGKTNGRIGQLDQYETKGTLTVNFRNGSAVVSKADKDQLEDFIKTASNTPGFMVQVQGYASAVGSATLNQRLSSERADAVLAIIQQSGAVPMTRILAPAAMGTSEQVADNHSRSGQKENRRVVVTILVNKGIVGSSDQTASVTQPGQ